MIGCAFPLLLIGGSQSALAALFYIAASFPWVVKMGRRVVIFFFSQRDCIPSLALFQPSCLSFREMLCCWCQDLPLCFLLPWVTYTDGSLPGTAEQSMVCVHPWRSLVVYSSLVSIWQHQIPIFIKTQQPTDQRNAKTKKYIYKKKSFFRWIVNIYCVLIVGYCFKHLTVCPLILTSMSWPRFYY